MPIGKEVATLTSNATSITKGMDAAGNHTFVLNCEGSVKGAWNGTALMTMTVTSADLKSGTYESTVAGYLEDGSTVTGSGTGVLGALGGHKWQLNGVGLVDDGTRTAFEAILSLGDRHLSGKVYAID